MTPICTIHCTFYCFLWLKIFNIYSKKYVKKIYIYLKGCSWESEGVGRFCREIHANLSKLLLCATHIFANSILNNNNKNYFNTINGHWNIFGHCFQLIFASICVIKEFTYSAAIFCVNMSIFSILNKNFVTYNVAIAYMSPNLVTAPLL